MSTVMMRRVLVALFCVLALFSIGLFMNISSVNMDAGFVYAQY